MNKQKVKGIVKFSIKQNIQNKWFVIFNILLLIMLIIMANANHISQFLEANNIKLFNNEITIEYIDNAHLITGKLEEQFKEYEKITIKRVEKNEYTKDNIDDNVIVLEVFEDEVEYVKAKITSKEGIDGAVYDEIVSILNEIRILEFSQNANVSVEKVKLLNNEISIERVMLGVNAENSDTKEMIQYCSTIIVYMISIFIFSKIANEIANEKVSKSIEYVLTSVNEKEYLLAKIISVTIVVLIQAMLVIVYYMIGNLLNSFIILSTGMELVAETNTVFATLDKDIIQYIVLVFVYSVLTLILLSIIQAALSSKTTNMSEAGNSMTFLIVITIAAYTLTFALINPYTNMTMGIYILSCIPLFSNYFIPAIMIIGQAKVWQIIISLVLLIISIPITFNICSKIFKNGVLDYNTKNAKKEKVKKELSLKEEQELKLEKTKYRTYALAIGLSVILYFVLQTICQLVLSTLGTSILEGIFNSSQIQLIIMAINSIISLIIPYVFISIYINKKENISKTTINEDMKMFFIGVFFTGLVQILLVFIQDIFGLENKAVEEILDIVKLDGILTQILFVTTIAIVPGIFEEILFRKGLINLTKGLGEKFAIMISSIVFAICHLNVTQGIFAFLMGLILGTIYVKTNKMRYNIIIHTLNNGYAALSVIFVFNNSLYGYLILNILIIIILVFSAFVFIKECIRKIKCKEKILILTGKILPKNIKYMFTDFTFVIGSLLMILAFIVTEAMLKIM